jgi:O-antigen/teichoic acid export membrane protein
MAVAQDHDLSGRLARGVSIYIAGLLMGKALVLVIQVLLGRLLGAAVYGLYTLGYSIVTLMQWPGSLGLDQGVLRYCALYRSRGELDQVKATLRRAVLVASISSFMVGGMLLMFSRSLAHGFLSSPRFGGVVAAFALALPFLVWTRIFATFAQAQHDILRMTLLQHIAQPLANLAFLLVAWALGYGLLGAVGAFVLCALSSALLGFHYLRHTLADSGPRIRAWPDHRPLLRYSMVLMFAGLSFQLILRIPNLLLGHLTGARGAGVYSAGSSFALAFNFVPLAFAQPFLPLMVELHEAGQRRQLHRLYHTVTRWTLAAVVPLFLFLVLFQDQVMRLFGHDFSDSGPVLALLSLGWLVYYAKGPSGGILEMTGRQNLELVNLTGIAVVLGVSAYLVIPLYGALGAAAVSAGAMVLWATVEFLQVRFIYDLVPWDTAALRHVLVSLAIAGSGIYLRRQLDAPLTAVFAVTLYVLLYFGFCLGHEDRLLLGTLLARIRGLGQGASVFSE